MWQFTIIIIVNNVDICCFKRKPKRAECDISFVSRSSVWMSSILMNIHVYIAVVTTFILQNICVCIYVIATEYTCYSVECFKLLNIPTIPFASSLVLFC